MIISSPLQRTQLLKLDVPATFMLVALDEGPGPPIKYQYAELGKLYSVVSQLVRCCDVSAFTQSSMTVSVNLGKLCIHQGLQLNLVNKVCNKVFRPNKIISLSQSCRACQFYCAIKFLENSPFFFFNKNIFKKSNFCLWFFEFSDFEVRCDDSCIINIQALVASKMGKSMVSSCVLVTKTEWFLFQTKAYNTLKDILVRFFRLRIFQFLQMYRWITLRLLFET